MDKVLATYKYQFNSGVWKDRSHIVPIYDHGLTKEKIINDFKGIWQVFKREGNEPKPFEESKILWKKQLENS